MIGVALGALTRNTIGAIVAALFVKQVILQTVMPSIEKWLPTAAGTGLTNATTVGERE